MFGPLHSWCFWNFAATKGAGDEVNPKPTALRAATHGSPFCIEHKKEPADTTVCYNSSYHWLPHYRGSRSTNSPPLALRQATTSFYLPFSPPFGGYSAVQAEGSRLFLTQPAIQLELKTNPRWTWNSSTKELMLQMLHRPAISPLKEETRASAARNPKRTFTGTFKRL